MALPTSGSLSIKAAAGSNRSVACEVDGNTSGNKSLLSLGNTAFGSSAQPHSILDFYGYSSSYVEACTNPVIFDYQAQSRSVTISSNTGDYQIFCHGLDKWVSYNPANSSTLCITIQSFYPSPYEDSTRDSFVCICNDDSATERVCVCQNGYIGIK